MDGGAEGPRITAILSRPEASEIFAMPMKMESEESGTKETGINALENENSDYDVQDIQVNLPGERERVEAMAEHMNGFDEDKSRQNVNLPVKMERVETESDTENMDNENEDELNEVVGVQYIEVSMPVVKFEGTDIDSEVEKTIRIESGEEENLAEDSNSEILIAVEKTIGIENGEEETLAEDSNSEILSEDEMTDEEWTPKKMSIRGINKD